MRGFSQRERQIVGAVLEAKAVKDIAVEFDLSVNTVKDYLKTIYRKAQVHSARELMVKLASGPEGAPPPPPDTALAQLLQTAQALAAAAAPQEALQQLGAAVRRCTRARRVSFWRVLRAPGELVLAPEAGGMPLHAAEFAHRILERGWARLEASQMRSLEGRQLAAAGLGGEVIGVACAPTVRVQILLAGDPVESHFGPLDAAVIRLLARLAGSQSDHHLSVLRASA
ncbi:MAG TPA: helix-turn-helix transcriptional regulator [Terriglobales bacterium]|nr:helix-turn-helix transcriptional regulator [Terriglobales bacterium]